MKRRSSRQASSHAHASPACASLRERLNEFLDGELPTDLDTAAREHLAVCERCRSEVEHQRAFSERVRRVRSDPAPDSFRARIREMLRGNGRQRDTVLARAVMGLVIAGALAFGARRARALSPGGVAAAVVVGTVCVAAGWGWGILLVAFFLASTALSRWRSGEKADRTGGIVAKGGERDARQVLANGGLFAAAAVLSLLEPWSGWTVLGAGALAAATADTWSTEIGTLSASPPMSLRSGRRVPPGTSGGVTTLGTIASVAGAAFIALIVWMVGWPPAAVAGALAGGIAGSTADSLLGATLQARRWCATCAVPTEREVHRCGTATAHAGGLSWLDNDGVNLLSGGAGALVAGIFLL